MRIFPRLRRLFDLRVGWAVLAGHLALASAFAEEQGAQTSAPKSAPVGGIVYVARDSSAAEHLMDSLVRVPAKFGAPRATESGGVRGIRPPPRLLVLAPSKAALSLSTRPTLYWYVSGPSTAPVRLSVQGLEATKPALQVDLGVARAAGVYATSLAEYGIDLERGGLYRWSVGIARGPGAHSAKPVAETVLAIDQDDPKLRAKLAGTPMLTQIRTLAESGYWYDAMDLLTRQVWANDASEPWRDMHAALLDQVGLQTVAVFERGGGQ